MGEGVGDTDAWSRTDDVTRFVGSSLGVTTPGATFTASKKAAEAGETLQATKAGLAVEAGTWADGIGVQRRVSSEVRSRLAGPLGDRARTHRRGPPARRRSRWRPEPP